MDRYTQFGLGGDADETFRRGKHGGKAYWGQPAEKEYGEILARLSDESPAVQAVAAAPPIVPEPERQ
jgi:hypothetical protein